jgi:hypothetical protein
MFDTKIAVIIRDDLAPWQALNVTASEFRKLIDAVFKTATARQGPAESRRKALR